MLVRFKSFDGESNRLLDHLSQFWNSRLKLVVIVETRVEEDQIPEPLTQFHDGLLVMASQLVADEYVITRTRRLVQGRRVINTLRQGRWQLSPVDLFPQDQIHFAGTQVNVSVYNYYPFVFLDGECLFQGFVLSQVDCIQTRMR